jgi:hypothetical protein
VLINENGKMRSVETIPGMGGRIKGMMERVNSNMIYCNNFGKCHNVPQYNNNMIIIKIYKNIFKSYERS